MEVNKKKVEEPRTLVGPQITRAVLTGNLEETRIGLDPNPFDSLHTL